MNAFGTVFRYELRRAWRERVLVSLLILFAAVVAYAAWNGRMWSAERQRALAIAAQDIAKSRAQTLARFSQSEQRSPERPISLGHLAAGIWYRPTLPLAPLAPLAIGQAEGYPFDARFHPTNTRGVFLPQAVTIDHPEQRAAGRFDLAFVVVFLLPLLLLAAVYDVWAGERESGTSRLLLAQPVSSSLVLSGKLLARGGTLLLGFTAILLAALVWTGAAPSGIADLPGGLGGCAAVVLIYGVFWLGVAAVLNVFVRGAIPTAVAAGAVWLFVVALLPAGLASFRDFAQTAPSRAARIGALRHAERELQERRKQEPAGAREASPSRDRDASMRSALTRSAEDQAALMTAQQPFRDREERRRQWADTLRFLAPSLLVQDSLERIAGTDASRALAFQTQVWGFIDELREFIARRLGDVEGDSVRERAQAVPEFAFREPSTAERRAPLVANLAALLGFIAALAVGACIGLRRRLLVELQS